MALVLNSNPKNLNPTKNSFRFGVFSIIDIITTVIKAINNTLYEFSMLNNRASTSLSLQKLLVIIIYRG